VAFFRYYGISKNKWAAAAKTRNTPTNRRNAERRANSVAWLTQYFDQVKVCKFIPLTNLSSMEKKIPAI